jgi:hypothetical protein
MNKELEAAIDKVGRQRVFDRARAYGWSGSGAPEFVWWGIIRELLQEGAKP